MMGKWKTYFDSLNLEFHVIFPSCFSVFSLLPTVSVATVAHFLSGVEQHGSALGSGKHDVEEADEGVENEIHLDWRRAAKQKK